MTENQVPAEARGYENFPGTADRTFAGSTPYWPEPDQTRRPNIVMVVVDDLGFSDFGSYGSEIETPTIDRMARDGLRFINYHTTPVCSPARASLMTGVNPHRAGFASVTAFDPGFPNLTLQLGDDVVTLPEVLRSGGYATFAIGKWHLTKDALINDAADKSSWPLQRGFDRFYGSLEGFNTYFAPNQLIRDNSPVEIDEFPDDYYLTDDLTDAAVRMLRGLRAHDADKPFFLYFAHHAMHGPLGAKANTMTKYRGRYGEGWNVLRRERFERQQVLGLWPDSVECAPDNQEAGYEVPPWDSVDPDQQHVMARYMEAYAGMVESIDESLARIVAVLEDNGELDNTIIVVTSDNGGATEGGVMGTRSYFSQFAIDLHLPAWWERDVPIDPGLIGGPRSMIHYPRGWTMASNTPFRLYKGSTFAGGVRVPFIVSWPAATRSGRWTSGDRDQYLYVTDVYPTLLEAAGLERPDQRHGVPVTDIDGASFMPILEHPDAPAVRTEQYSEYDGHRGLYAKGWKLLTLHERGTPYEDSEWQLYDVQDDPTEMRDVAGDHPDVVRELATRWEKLAWHNTVFPLDDHSGVLVHRQPPHHVKLSSPVRLFPDGPVTERYRAAQLIKLRSFRVLVDGTHRQTDQGVIFSHGDQGGGYLVYAEEGELHLGYNEYGAYSSASAAVVGPISDLQLAAEVLPEFRWRLSLHWNGAERVSLGPVAMLVGLSPWTGINVGADRGGPVSWELYERRRAFPYDGALRCVEYRPGKPADYDPALVHDAAYRAAVFYD